MKSVFRAPNFILIVEDISRLGLGDDTIPYFPNPISITASEAFILLLSNGWTIEPTSCTCGGLYAWYAPWKETRMGMKNPGIQVGRGCICHNDPVKLAKEQIYTAGDQTAGSLTFSQSVFYTGHDEPGAHTCKRFGG